MAKLSGLHRQMNKWSFTLFLSTVSWGLSTAEKMNVTRVSARLLKFSITFAAHLSNAATWIILHSDCLKHTSTANGTHFLECLQRQNRKSVQDRVCNTLTVCLVMHCYCRYMQTWNASRTWSSSSGFVWHCPDPLPWNHFIRRWKGD